VLRENLEMSVRYLRLDLSFTMLGSNVSNGTYVVNMGCPTLVTSSQESGFHLPFYLLSRGVIVTFGKKSKRDRFRKWIILSIAKPWFDRRFCLAE
jgi:hypothetical protein